jgi:hypothetical protein
LLKTLISVYLSIITAPLQILAGTLVPSMGFGAWFKKLIADILVFPVTGLVCWFAWALLWSAYAQAAFDVSTYWKNHVFTIFGGAGGTPDAWIPGIIGASGLGASSGITGILFLAMSFGMIVLIPKIPDMLKGMILGEKFSFGTAMGEAYGPIGGALKGAGGMASGAALGGGAIWLGTKLEGRGSPLVQGFGRSLKGYGNKSLGNLSGNREGATKSKAPGEVRE